MTDNGDNKADASCSPSRKLSGKYRFTAALLAAGCLGILILAAMITPSASGMGTHRQLALPACGFLQRTGYPCVTCGMTTSFSHMVRGHFVRGFATQPAGAVGAMLCGVTVIVAGYTAITGRRVDKIMDYLSFHAVGLLIAGVIMVVGAWGWLCLMVRFGVKS